MNFDTHFADQLLVAIFTFVTLDIRAIELASGDVFVATGYVGKAIRTFRAVVRFHAHVTHEMYSVLILKYETKHHNHHSKLKLTRKVLHFFGTYLSRKFGGTMFALITIKIFAFLNHVGQLVSTQIIQSLERPSTCHANMLTLRFPLGFIVATHMLMQVARCSECVRAIGKCTFERLVTGMNANVSVETNHLGIMLECCCSYNCRCAIIAYLVKSPVQVNARWQYGHSLDFCLQ